MENTMANAWNYDPIEMDETLCKSVYTLNTWTEDRKTEARKLLEEGYWVHFGSTCIGHTLSRIVTNAGFAWAEEQYGDALEIRPRKGWGEYYARLK